MNVDALTNPAVPRPLAAGGGTVFEQLRDMIRLAHARAGDGLVAIARCKRQFGLSSTPVRDALMRLEEAGLVEVFPQSGTIVSLIDVPLARQAQFLRRAIEQEAVRTLAAPLMPRLVDQAPCRHRRAEASGEAGDLERFNDADLPFTRFCTMPPVCLTSGRWCAIAADTSIASAGCICPSAARPIRSSGIIPRS